MTKPDPSPERPTTGHGDQSQVKSGKATDGETPDDSAPPQDPDDDGSEAKPS